jgi:ribonuclease J
MPPENSGPRPSRPAPKPFRRDQTRRPFGTRTFEPRGTSTTTASVTGVGPAPVSPRTEPGTGAAKKVARRRFGANARPPKRVSNITHRDMPSETKARGPIIPAPGENVIRVIQLGGVEEIGRNMSAVEIGDDIIIIDCGLQFSEDDTPGIDYILPNTQYLEERRHKIRGMLITHGHLDHIGGIPYILDRIGNPTIYTRKLTGMMVKKRHAEFVYMAQPVIREVEKGEVITLGKLKVSFFAVTHTVPDSMGIIIHTPWGGIVHTGDVKLDHEDGEPTDEEKEAYSVFKDQKTLLLMMDSTNVERPGFSIPERKVFETLSKIISDTPKRLIIGTFASQLERLMHIVRIAEDCGKKIVIDGRSMRTNIEIVREMALLKHRDDTIIPIESMEEYPPEKIVILATGAQGDQFASLMRIGNKQHRFIRLTPDDIVVLSSSVIPGNERSVQKLKDNISRQGTRIITYHSSDVHASGHGNREEAVWVHKQIKPKFFIPLHGYHYMHRVHAEIAEENGVEKGNVALCENGSIVEIINGEKMVRSPYKAPAELRVVEGQSVGMLSDVVMRDRKTLAGEGFCVVVATIDKRTGKLHKSPDILSRGFVYLRDNKDLMDQTRLIIRRAVEQSFKHPAQTDIETARNELADAVSQFLLQKTQKNPIVMPVIVTI